MESLRVIGIDLGGTNVRAGLVGTAGIEHLTEQRIDAQGSAEHVLEQIYEVVDQLDIGRATGIGIGVPSVVDTTKGIVYDVVNIPAWKEVAVKSLLEDRYGLPTWVNNDANCFALAEQHFGAGRGMSSFIGLIIGTGMAGGVIIDGKLYEGRNCGAGEFGMMGYLDHYYEYYSSGQFFSNVYGISGKEAAQRAQQNDPTAIAMWQEFGGHLGRAFEAILLAYDPELIVLGGSVGKAFDLYEHWVWETLRHFPFPNSVTNLQICSSTLEEPGLLGAAALAVAGKRPPTT